MSSDNVYAAAYSELNLWRKLNQAAETAGINLAERALMLYYVQQRARTPQATKALIIGALGYFIAPVDAVPDAIVAVGYADDLGVLTWVCHTARPHVTDGIMRKAEQKALSWFRPAIERQRPSATSAD